MDYSELINARRSCRDFAPGNAPTAEELTAMMQQARMAPSWKNSETAHFYAALSPDAVQAVRHYLPDYNQNSTKNAGAYVVTAFEKGVSGFAGNMPCTIENGDEWGAFDLGLIDAYFVLAAKDCGYDTLIMGLHDAQGLRQYFGIPDSQEIMAVIAVGRAAAAPELRPRKDVREIVTVK